MLVRAGLSLLGLEQVFFISSNSTDVIWIVDRAEVNKVVSGNACDLAESLVLQRAVDDNGSLVWQA